MNSQAPPDSPYSDDNKRLSKTKSWGRMINIRAPNAAETAEGDWAGHTASPKSNEEEMAGLLVSEPSASMRTDPMVPKLSRESSADSERSGGTSQIQSGDQTQNSANSRILVRHRSTRPSSQAYDREKETAGPVHDRVSASASLDRHCS